MKVAVFNAKNYDREFLSAVNAAYHEIIRDDVFPRLLTFPNVIISGHQAFFTRETLENITATTIDNITCSNADRRSKIKSLDRVARGTAADADR